MIKIGTCLLLMLALTSCAAGQATARVSPPASPRATTRVITFTLQPQNGSAATARGQIEVTSLTSFTVTLTVSGLAPASVHASHIHRGVCGGIGPIAVALENVVADGSGNATAVTWIDSSGYSPAAQGWYANVHAGPDLTGPNARGILCGNLPD